MVQKNGCATCIFTAENVRHDRRRTLTQLLQSRPQPQSALTDFGLQSYSPSLPVNGLYPRNSCNYMDYYSFIDLVGIEG